MSDIAAGDLGTSVSGMSGGVSNRELIKELEEVALEHVRKRYYTLNKRYG